MSTEDDTEVEPRIVITGSPAALGPHLVHGARRIEHPDGLVEITASTVALCACGRSKAWPRCDGSHCAEPPAPADVTNG